MLVTIDRAAITDLIDLASKFVSRNSTLPILENVCIKGSGNTLSIRATDMEKHIDIAHTIDIEHEGAITINAKTCIDFLKTLTSETISLRIDEGKNTLQIESHADSITIKGIPANEYVALPQIDATHSFTIPAKDLFTGIENVSFAVIDKSFTPVLTGVLIRTKQYDGEEHIVFTGSDSFRLAEYKIPLATPPSSPIAIIIPKSNTVDIVKGVDYMMNNEIEDLQVQISENMVVVGGSNESTTVSISSILVKGTFPDYENEDVIPTQYTTSILIDKQTIENAIKKIAILTRASNNYVQSHISSGQMRFESGLTDLGEATSTVDVITSGDNCTIAYNGRYITDILKFIDNPQISLNIASPQKPLVIKDKNNAALTYIVRPLNPLI